MKNDPYSTPIIEVIWFVLKNTIGIRIGKDEELGGLDMWEIGSKAYPEFMSDD